MTILKWIGILFFSFLLLLALFIGFMNWNWARDYVVEQFSELTGRTLVIGDIDIDWSWVPRIRLEQIQFENAAWSDRPYMLELDKLEFQIDLPKLIQGHVVLPEVGLFGSSIFLEKSSDGKANWELDILPVGDPAPDDRDEFPVIQRLKIEDGLISYLDPLTDTDLKATIVTARGKQKNNESITMQAKGKLKGEKLKVTLKADSLLELRETDAPYKLALGVRLGKTVAIMAGSLKEPLHLKGLNMNFEVKGPNPGRLSKILDFPLPDLPPYRIKGDLSRQGNMLKFTNFDGRVGDSDLTGDITINMDVTPLFIKADLYSKKIDLDDLGPLIGIAPDAGPGETASQSQQIEDKREKTTPTVLPRDKINFDALYQVGADIRLQGKRVESKLPIDDLKMHIIIDGRHLTLAPLDFGVADGNIKSRIEIDAGRKPVKSKMETEIQHIRLSEILNVFEVADESAGIIGGRGMFWLTGDSISEMLGTADGGLLMLMTGGRFESLLVEIAGLDLGETLAALIGDQKETDINCAFVDFPVKNGMMNMNTFVVDTKDTVFLGKGTIDLSEELLDLVIDPKPKDLSLFSARAPLHIEGRFSHPEFTPGSSAIIRGAASLALLPSAPIASLISLLHEDGGEENIHCSGLVDAINEAR